MNPVQSEKFKELIVVHNFAMERELVRCSDAFRDQVSKHYVRGRWIEDSDTDRWRFNAGKALNLYLRVL